MPDPSAGGPIETTPGRLVRIEGAIEVKQPPSPPTGRRGKDFWDKLSALAPFLSGAVVVIVGYYLTGSVNNALRREEVQLANVTEMRELLLSLQGPEPDEWQAAAFTLSAFGPPAVPPLITALTVSDEVRSPYIESALRAIGLTRPDSVCLPMIGILANHTGRISWLMHKSAIRLIGDLRCPEAVPALRRYAEIVNTSRTSGNADAYAQIVDPAVPIGALALERMGEDLERTLRIVEDQ
jgi:hypothetical protein